MSCHAGASLFRSPVVSLVPHPICVGFEPRPDGQLCARAPTDLGPASSLLRQPSRPTGPPQGTTPSGTREKHRALSSQTYRLILFRPSPLCCLFSPFSRQARAPHVMYAFNNLFSISGGGEGWEPIYNYRPDERDSQPMAAGR